MKESDKTTIQQAVKALLQCKSVLVGAGAGMGVDSGLPDFRGNEGFWKAYPPLAQLGIRFEEMADPNWFVESPQLAWGFYGHRLNLYGSTNPHPGFSILRKWFKELNLSSFVFTSNVDGQFQRSGFPNESIMECHGSLFHLQCVEECGIGIWPAQPGLQIEIDPETLLAQSALPACPTCSGLARPNILMFSDFHWDPTRTNRQGKRLNSWLTGNENPDLLIIELGAGPSIPSVRNTCEQAWKYSGGTFLRINPRDPQVEPNALSLAMGAQDALLAIDRTIDAGRVRSSD